LGHDDLGDAAQFAGLVSQLPSSLIGSLLETTESGDSAGLVSLIEKQVVPAWPSLGEHLLHLARGYKYDQITRMLNPEGGTVGQQPK
jgi:hypothetical protein